MPSVSAGKTGKVHGTVTSPDGTTPASGATVVLLQGTQKLTATTATDGTYKYDNVAAGECEVEASLASLKSEKAKVEVTAGQDCEVNLKLN
jgi:hypothetical protein